MTNTLFKISFLQHYIHWLKDTGVNINIRDLDLGMLEYAYQIAKRNMDEYGLFPTLVRGW